MQILARKQLHLVASRPVARPPSTPDEIDDAKHEALMTLGRIALLLLLLIVVCLGTVGMLLQEPVATTTVQVRP